MAVTLGGDYPGTTGASKWSVPLTVDRIRGVFDRLPGVVILKLRGAQVADRGV